MAGAEVVARDGTTGQISLGPRTRKLTPGEAGFRQDGGIPGLSCGDCRYFVQGECFIVDVRPDPEDYCDEFNPQLEGGNVPSMSGQTLEYLSKTKNLYITRVASDPKTGEKRWYATSSGVKRDAYGERMSVELFRDFIRRIDAGEAAPTVFASDSWSGGNPYLGVAHYLDLDGFGIVGDCQKVYLDPDHPQDPLAILKARGTFRSTPVADAAFQAIQDDIERGRPPDERVRISIAFVDWGHEHEGFGTFKRESLTDRCPLCARGVGEIVYRRGQLVHLALTRAPAYPETEIALEERSVSTKREDAASIIGDKLAEELERKSKPLTIRGVAELITKSDAAPGFFGGAVSLDQAEAFIAGGGAKPVVDSWGILAGVLANITRSDAPDRTDLIRRTLEEFQQSLDVLTARTLREIAPLIAAQGGKSMETPTTEPTPEPAPEPTEPAIVTKAEGDVAPANPAPPAPAAAAPEAAPAPAPGANPLDEALAAFKAAFDEAMATQADTGARLAALQPALDALAEVVMRLVGAAAQPAAPAAEATAPSPEMAQMSAAVERMTAMTATLLAEIEVLKKERTAAPAPPAAPPVRPPLVPRSQPASLQRRQFRLVPRTMTVPGAPLVNFGEMPVAGEAPVVKRTSNLTNMIRASVGAPPRS